MRVASTARQLATWAAVVLCAHPAFALVLPEPMIDIPAGEFAMGTNARGAESQQKPAHHVNLEAFAIDRTEVPVREYRKCIEAGVCREITSGDPIVTDAEWFATFEDDEPMREVSWDDARTYCAWVRKRLPTEAEWEKASRGPRHHVNPWGDRPFRPGDANIAGKSYSAVGSRPKDVSGYGVMDTAGSVAEWVADWYSADFYGRFPRDDARGPPTGTKRVVRGGSWRTGVKGEARRSFFSTTRYGLAPDEVSDVIGFRCAESAGNASR